MIWEGAVVIVNKTAPTMRHKNCPTTRMPCFNPADEKAIPKKGIVIMERLSSLNKRCDRKIRTIKKRTGLIDSPIVRRRMPLAIASKNKPMPEAKTSGCST